MLMDWLTASNDDAEFELVPVTPSAAESWFTRKGWVSN